MNASVARQRSQVAVLTAPGRSAVAVIAAAGPDAVEAMDRHFEAVNRRPFAKQPLGRIVYGHWGGAGGEDVVVCRRKSEEVEIHCHGGAASSSQVVEQLSAAGCAVVDWQQWLADRSDCPLVTAAHTALTQAHTLRTATILLDQYHGALRNAIDSIRIDLKKGSIEVAQEKILELLMYAEFGRRLTHPWRVVLSGLPNVGKSSLINALVGYERAVVYDQPGTTRDVVSATTAANGWPVQLSDTAGLHAAADELEGAGIAEAQRELQDADLVLWVLDASQFEEGLEPSVEEVARQQSCRVGSNFDWSRGLVVVNKIDLIGGAISWGPCSASTCALTGEGIAELLAVVATRLVPQPPPQGAPIPFTGRQIACLQEALCYCEQSELLEAETVLADLWSQAE